MSVCTAIAVHTLTVHMVCTGYWLFVVLAGVSWRRACRGAGASVGGAVALGASEWNDLWWCG